MMGYTSIIKKDSDEKSDAVIPKLEKRRPIINYFLMIVLSLTVIQIAFESY